MADSYSTSIKDISSLSTDEINSIVALYLCYYDGSDASIVVSDLKSKTHILLLLQEDVLIGFTTFEFYDSTWDNKCIGVIYSGDTIVHHEHWGQQALAFTWLRFISKLKQATPSKPFYWFLIVKGHRTYRYLPAFSKSFYPHWTIDRSDLKPLLDFLAEEKFGNHYNKDSGIIAFENSRGHLKKSFVFPTENEIIKPAVKFFLERNPRYHEGHELACICSLDDINLKSFTKRISN